MGIMKKQAVAFLNMEDAPEKGYLSMPEKKKGFEAGQAHYQRCARNLPRKSLASHAKLDVALNEGAVGQRFFNSRFVVDADHTATHVKKLINEIGTKEDAQTVYEMLCESKEYREEITKKGVKHRYYSDEQIWEVIQSCPSVMLFLEKGGYRSYPEILAWEAGRVQSYEKERLREGKGIKKNLFQHKKTAQ